MRSGTALLGRSSARVRRLGVGGRLHLAGGSSLKIVGVVDDGIIGAAEVVVTVARGRKMGVTWPRYVVARLSGRRRVAADDIRRAAGSAPVRIARPSQAPLIRDAAGVLPQSRVKLRFGEFAYRRGSGSWIGQSNGWVSRQITTAEVPILGRVRCHRRIIPALRGALSEIRSRGLSQHIHRGDYGGCHAARFTPSTLKLSRHSWGIALDLNVSSNPFGSRGRMDRQVVAVFSKWGFGWGGHWLRPDPMHFEYLHPPG